MRHREDVHQTSQAQRLSPGKHRAPGAAPRIPAQSQPTHDVVAPALPLVVPAEVEVPAEVAAADVVEAEPAARPAPAPRPASRPEPTPQQTFEIPQTARWRASHLPRTVAAATLLVAVVGTAALGARYTQSRSSDDFVSLAIGLGVVVVLWAVVIASTPQVVTLNGSVLTVSNTSGSEDFDLADALQPIDVVGNPRTSHWAVLLHRLNSTTVVLRRNEVVATELDPIVRHYRMVAEQRHLERDARFNR